MCAISSNSRERFQILVLSGGGIRGIYTASVLEALERKAGKPVAQCFDLIAGTSIGGIIGLALALEVPASRIANIFRKHGTLIFSDRPLPRSTLGKGIDLMRSVLRPKYQQTQLRAAVCQLVGEDTRIEDLSHPIIIPTVNMTSGAPQFFKTPHHDKFMNDWEIPVVDVALATSAAPTFFPLAEIKGSHYADGGLYANSPDLCALHEAIHFLEIPEGVVHVISIGTTTTSFSLSHRIGRDLGSLRWMLGNRLLSTVFSAQQQSEEFMLKHRLGERYLRIDDVLSKEQQEDVGLDIATESVQSMLIARGIQCAKRALGEERLLDALAYTAKTPTFFHGKRADRGITHG